MARPVKPTRQKPKCEVTDDTRRGQALNGPNMRRQHLLQLPSWIRIAVVSLVALLAMPAVLHLSRSVSRSVVASAPLASSTAGRHLHKLSPSPSPSTSSASGQPSAPAASKSSPARPASSPSQTSPNRTATRAFSGGSMSTQKLRYRDPIVFNARDKHTGEHSTCTWVHTRLASQQCQCLCVTAGCRIGTCDVSHSTAPHCTLTAAGMISSAPLPHTPAVSRHPTWGAPHQARPSSSSHHTPHKHTHRHHHYAAWPGGLRRWLGPRGC